MYPENESLLESFDNQIIPWINTLLIELENKLYPQNPESFLRAMRQELRAKNSLDSMGSILPAIQQKKTD
ncbi:hypothetical protein [Coxiella-like endosymbiont]|uniref:hypothetical protein n=1 Tax=Coxiella-like endosymbiont TaxID=1592897 RepID=UPI00272ACEA7|nr:hypothetical protein [Coxiella-like endosymbiont]